jgi:hypothetical protein
METKVLKINVAQRVLGTNNSKLLEKIKNLLDEEAVFAYDSQGKPITESDYKKDLDKINADIDSGKAKLYSTEEVRQYIANENKLEL